MIKIGFTGTRQGMTPAQKQGLILIFRGIEDEIEFHHGDCVGADEQAHRIARDCGIKRIVLHPPVNETYRAFCIGFIEKSPKDYLIRNHEIVDDCDILIAAPAQNNEILRSGTWATVRYARKRRKQISILVRR